MALSFDGSDQHCPNSSAVLTAAPITMACWFNTNDRTNTQAMISLVDASVANQYFILRIQASTEDVTATAREGSATNHNAPTKPTNGQWHHAVAVFAGSTSRTAYIDGVTSGTDTGNRTPTGIDTTGVGSAQDSTASSYFDGELAEAAIWNVALSAGEIASLAAGASPLYIRAGNLKAYWPLGGPLSNNAITAAGIGRDMMGGYNVTPTNAPTAAAHPYQIFNPHSHIRAFGAGVEVEESTPTPAEADLTGDDVITEIISANLRRQGGICVNSGGINFAERDNDIVIAAQNQLTELDAKYVKQDRQDHRDEIPTDPGNSVGWFGA